MAVRVAHLIHSLEIGGTERRLLALAAALDRTRFSQLLVCIDELGPLTEEARALGFEPVLLGRRWRFDATGIVRLARLLRRKRIDVVHGWMWMPSVFARVAGTAAAVPVRVAAEGAAVTTNDPVRARRNGLVDRALGPLTDAWVVNSRAVAATLEARGIPCERIVAIPNGVAVPPPLSDAERARLRRSLVPAPANAIIGMVARLDPEFKDHATFVAAVGKLVDEGRDIVGVIVGDGPARAVLERAARERSLADRIIFTGFRSDAAQLVQAFDVSVLLTYSEGFSNVILESMAAGIATVATDIPSNREAIDDGRHGLLVPVGDVASTSDALRRLLDEPSLSRRLGTAARDRVAHEFSLDAQAHATMELYDDLLARRRAGTR